MKGGSALYTAKAASVEQVAHEFVQEWGEAFWTAKDLAFWEFEGRLNAVAVKRLILG